MYTKVSQPPDSRDQGIGIAVKPQATAKTIAFNAHQPSEWPQSISTRHRHPIEQRETQVSSQTNPSATHSDHHVSRERAKVEKNTRQSGRYTKYRFQSVRFKDAQAAQIEAGLQHYKHEKADRVELADKPPLQMTAKPLKKWQVPLPYFSIPTSNDASI